MFENVLLLVADSLRQDFLATNQTDTPTLDRLRRDGVDFTRARSPGPGTSVSTPALLSGAFPFTYGYKDISPDRPMVAPRLSEAGYDTAGYHSNGWCSAERGYARGFDDFHQFTEDRAADPVVRGVRRLLRELKSGFPNHPRLTDLRRTELGEAVGNRVFEAVARTIPEARNDVTVDASKLHGRLLEWVDATASPRFVWHQYMDTHFPYMAPDSEFTPSEQLWLNYRLTRNRVAGRSIPPAEQRSILGLYREEITYLDRELGTLLRGLESRGELSETLIVFTADHGELLGEFGQFGHRSARLGSPLTHVPLVVWSEDLPARRVHTPVSLVDVVPTIYDYLGVAPPDGLDGRSLRPVIDGDEEPTTPALSEMGHDPMDFGGPPSKETTVVSVETDSDLVVGDWLHDDPPSEDLPEYELLRGRREMLDAGDDSYAGDSDMSGGTKRRLRDLGYLE
ncbi:sulfatase [Candidatus Halobonum tyrrellensis G22]|uniref:Sulfatase n=2 Tax=Candidatus Halobonum TaxID=1431544 RepID=V4J0H0_9EURY|nr:sulfatase [Candidatus Halobonum tyrrellensis G22]